MTFEANGIPFVSDRTSSSVVSGLTIDVQSSYGREGVVARHRGWGSTC